MGVSVSEQSDARSQRVANDPDPGGVTESSFLRERIRELEAEHDVLIAIAEAAQQVVHELDDLDTDELYATPNGILLATGGLANALAVWRERKEQR